ncbi:MAG: group II intron reverse transcriptase/maturase [Saprospiraceae bacterium]|nr:group II intron reverse transcriptase/maturase [Saprospiraceae bacterium]
MDYTTKQDRREELFFRTGMTLESILDGRNVLNALSQVVGNGGAPGVDGMKTDEVKSYILDHWGDLQKEILEGRYRPQAVRRVEIPKPNGGVRQLGIPTVLDRVLQQSIAQELDKLYDGTFSVYSYGFRKGKSAHDAIEQALNYLNEGRHYVVEIDLEKFFDRVNHDKLMFGLSLRIADKRVLKLIRHYLQAGTMENGVIRRNEEGTPQGGNLSPILSNIVLDRLDKELEKRGHKFVRYADDISIFVSSRRAGERVLEGCIAWIEKELKLKVNREKSGVREVSKAQILGFGFYYGSGGVIEARISHKSYNRLSTKLKDLTRRSWSISMAERLGRITQVTRGWVNYFGIARGKSRLLRLDEWLRSRLRMCIWKQWKKVKTRYKSLRQLSVPHEQAYMWANTRKGYWRTAHSPILTLTITIPRLKERGYIPLMELYTHKRNTLTNRRDTRPVRPVV